jgi:hypothetical protein
MGRGVFIVLFLCAGSSAFSEHPTTWRGRAQSLGRFLWESTLPNFNFRYENEPLALKHVSLFGRVPFEGTSLERFSIPTPALKAYRLLEDVGLPTLRTLKVLFLPGMPVRLESKVDRLLREGVKRDLSEEELSKLEKYGQRERFERHRAAVTHQKPCAKWMGRLSTGVGAAGTWAFRGVAALSALHATRMLADAGSTPSIDEYLKNPRYAPKPDEIQFWSETTPPHLAVRVRDKVYSYGVSHLTATTPEEYLRTRELGAIRLRILELYANEDTLDPETREELHRLFPKEDFVLEADDGAHRDSSGRFLDWAALRLGADKLERSIQVVSRRIGEKEVDRLRRKLEMLRGVEYANETMVNDCATMVCRETGLWNPLRDSLPGTLITTLSAQRVLDPSITDVFEIEADAPHKRKRHIIRNAYINYLEGSLGVSSSWYNLPARAVFDFTKKEKDRQWWTPVGQQVLAEYKTESEKENANDGRVILFKRRARQIAALTAESKDVREAKEAFLEVIKDHFDAEIAHAKEIEEFPQAEQKEVLMAKYRLEFLESARSEILETVGAK